MSSYLNETKNCQNCKKDFTIESEDFSFYEKIKVPPPTFCPECRMIRRFNFRNEAFLFRRKDTHDDKEIFSGFSPETGVVTYENSYWFGGDWDSLVNGFEYDFSKTFFEQFKKLILVAPIPARSVHNMVNSDYCNEASECKNTYLCFNVDYIENSAYLRKARSVKESFDCYEVEGNELCYEGIAVDKSYQTMFSLDCESCVDVWFSKSLRGCTNCFGCVNLTNKSNYFFNEPLSKEEYSKKVNSFLSGSYKELLEIQNKAFSFWLNFPNKFYHGNRIIESTGERIFNTKNVKDSYYVKGSENVRFSQDIWNKTANSYDHSIGWDGVENTYECVTCGMGVSNIKFSFNCWEGSRDLEYCTYCINSNDCFGCVGLYKKQYCIFNKQYSKEEYFSFVEKIKTQMDNLPYVDEVGRVYKYGEFFPYDISPYAYSESLAQDFFPLTSNTAKEKGFSWREITVKDYKITLNAEDLADNIKDASESILNEVIKCSACPKAYRIINSELQFYKRFNLPLPRKCHNCRFTERFKLVNPPNLWPRQCMCDKKHTSHEGKCEVQFETSYTPDRPEIVYCEKCYQQEVY